jgi:hypothetical protein
MIIPNLEPSPILSPFFVMMLQKKNYIQYTIVETGQRCLSNVRFPTCFKSRTNSFIFSDNVHILHINTIGNHIHSILLQN